MFGDYQILFASWRQHNNTYTNVLLCVTDIHRGSSQGRERRDVITQNETNFLVVYGNVFCYINSFIHWTLKWNQNCRCLWKIEVNQQADTAGKDCWCYFLIFKKCEMKYAGSAWHSHISEDDYRHWESLADRFRFKLNNRFEIWQAHRQQCCRDGSQFSER